MASNSRITFTIAFNDPDLDSEELDEQAQRLVSELRQIDEVDEVNRVIAPNPPEGNKSMGGFLVGLLMAQVTPDNAKKLLGFLGDRLDGKPIELFLEATGKS
ncbi:MAG: hypothetical protein WCP16_07815 [Pseudanabaena sp. ELA645]|jgi:hypothetical protein